MGSLSYRFRHRLLEAIKDDGRALWIIAARSGYSESYISAITNGRRANPSLEFVEVMAQTLGRDPEWLLGLKGEGAPLDAERLRRAKYYAVSRAPANEREWRSLVISAPCKMNNKITVTKPGPVAGLVVIDGDTDGLLAFVGIHTGTVVIGEGDAGVIHHKVTVSNLTPYAS